MACWLVAGREREREREREGESEREVGKKREAQTLRTLWRGGERERQRERGRVGNKRESRGIPFLLVARTLVGPFGALSCLTFL